MTGASSEWPSTTLGLASNVPLAPNFSLVIHAASATLTTNQPSLAGTRPASTVSRRASCTSESLRARLDVVDLRLLQLAAVVDVDRLPFREHVERRLTRLAVAIARV